MPLRYHGHTFLVVTASGRPLAVYRGLPKPERMALASQGPTLVYDLDKLGHAEHRRLLEALAVLRELPYLAPGAPEARLLGGVPFLTIPEGGKATPGERLHRALGLLRNTR
jgi:hypothetical protein